MARVSIVTEQGCKDTKVADLKKLLAARKSLLWVDMVGPTDEDIRIMEDVFQFHPVAIEDTYNHKQHPKMDHYPDFLFGIINTIDIALQEVRHHEVDFFVGKNYVVTVHTHREDAIDAAFNRIDREAPVSTLSPGLLLYLIMDSVIDRYFPVLDALSDQIEDLEDKILDNPHRENLNELFKLRRGLINLWRVVWPQRDMVSVLSHHSTPFMDQDELQPYLRDLYDHLLWIADMVNTFRDTATGIMDLYMSAVSNRLNRVVNRLTVLTVVIGTLAVITGFYGMNFQSTWPPFESWWGVPFVLVVITLIALGVIFVIRRDDGI